MAALIEAISIKRKMFFEYEGAPYHCLDVEVSKPTARGGQTLVRLKMRNLLTRAVFDKEGRMVVLMTHNSDFGDAFEREGDDPEFFYKQSVLGYGFGINVLLYALTH